MQPSRASRTAEFMAFFRALESARPERDRLFSDPLAPMFLAPGLRALAWACRASLLHRGVCGLTDRLWPGARPAGVARTRLIDDALLCCHARGLDQVAILGAGFDSRATRLPQLRGTRVFEVEHPATLAARRRRLGRAGLAPGPAAVAVSVDFESQRLEDQMQAAGYRPDRRTCFVWEGVSHYLSAAAVDEVLGFVRSAAPGSALLFTYVDRRVLDTPDAFEGTRRLRRTLRRAGESWRFGLDPSELPAFLEARGLHLVWDHGSLEYRARYLGRHGRHLRGYAFYRTALARIAERSLPRSA